MQFDLSEEQHELVTFIRSLLQQRSDSTAVRRAIASDAGFDPEVWRVLCEEIGAASLAIPEEYGGAGFTAYETHLVLEELGYALTPSPYLGSVAIAAQALLASGNDEACARLLPGIAAGTSIATLAWGDAVGRWSPDTTDVVATPGEPWRLSGTVPLVLDGTAADVVLVIAQTPDGPGLFEVIAPEAIERDRTPAVDPTLQFATLRFDGTPAVPIAIGDAAHFDAVRDRALTAISALQVGAAARGLDMTVDYAKQRVQFGRQIGSFQALKHRMADLHVRVDTARTASRAAAWAVANDAPEVPELAALAKSWCSEGLDLVASETVQLHGGIGITWEHDAQLVFKRAHATGQLFGTASEQRTRLAHSLGIVGG
ncbi:acyl-CoA dehydrogenase family protein [Agromyces sp. NPDC058484]|uniref:acyl-CoA dehydrogenase family protein n=1 Tax=Agromyces sp. NPDC058484 TaxID=3346524 RepID=UPI00364F767E